MSKSIFVGSHSVTDLQNFRFFMNVASSISQQKSLLETTINRTLQKNRTNSMEGSPPLTYKQIVELSKSVLVELVPGCPEHLLQVILLDV